MKRLNRPTRFPVYLCTSTVKDRVGATISFAERRLIRQSADDRVIAVIIAPAGTRVRRRKDQHGADQLVVPLGTTFWGRLFGRRIAIPAKYVIGDARYRAHGLSLAEPTNLEPVG